MSNSTRSIDNPISRQEFVINGHFLPLDNAELKGSVPERFERIVNEFPERPAIKTADLTINYETLDRISNRVAQGILAHRGPDEETVAVLMQHGTDIVAAIFGILKAGKGYVALFPGSPLPKLASILEDSQAKLILTDGSNLSAAAELAQDEYQIMNFEEIEGQFPDERVSLPLTADSLASIRYTSGSTGNPKGIARKHSSLLHSTFRMLDDYYIRIEDHCALLFSCSFGASSICIFGSLLNGATLYPYDPREGRLDQLADWLIREEITLLNLPVTLYRQLLDSLNEGDTFPKVRLVCPAGQALYKHDLVDFKKHFLPGCVLENKLGSSEAGMVTHFFADHKTELTGRALPVGYPREDTQLLLLDKDGRDVGLNRPGEIAIRSPHLVEGYWRRPDLSQGTFLPDPEGGNERIYRTGDQGIRRSDGCLEFLGREDFQVKIRGYRVELREVEEVLSQHPAVREVAVVPWENDSGEDYLVAYFAPNRGQEPTVSELRSFIQQKLPEYMVPSTFMMLETMPLTHSGKVDRNALPDPDRSRSGIADTFIPPRDTLEVKLAGIWEDVLEVKPIGAKDNFFDLGGHSLKAVRLFDQIDKTFGKKLPLATLFQSPTVEQLADVFRQEGWSPSWSPLVPIQPDGPRPPFFCVHALHGNVLSYSDLARDLGTDQPFYGLQAHGLEEGQTPHTDMGVIAASYIEEIRKIQPEGPYFLGGWSFGGLAAFEMAQQLHTQGEKVALLALFDTQFPKTSLQRIIFFLGHNCRRFPHRVRNLFSTGFRRYFLKVAKISGKRVEAKLTGQDLRHNRSEIGIASTQAIENYVMKPYPGRITMFLAGEREVGIHTGGPGLGWQKVAGGGLEIHEIPGDHATLITEPNVSVLAEKLGACLRKVQEDESHRQA